MDEWFVYLLRCKDGSVYTGITLDVDRRMLQHEGGTGSKYVRSKGFDKLLYALKVGDKGVAARMEYAAKKIPKHERMQFFREHELRVI